MQTGLAKRGTLEEETLAGCGGEVLTPSALQLAFKRFNEAGTRLEAKYENLRRETEELRMRLREKDAEIARTARLAMLGETAAAIAHEVRNPLGSIKLFVSLLRQDLKEPSALELIEGVNKSINTLDNVVSNILQFARDTKTTLAPVNLHSIIQEQVRALLPSGGPELEVRFELNARPFVVGNEHGLRQVFFNLLLNALQAMRYKGRICIRTESSGGELSATVEDSGPGIAEAVREKLFEPFVTTKNEGTGLGLAIVKKILLQHNGRVEAQNCASAGADMATGGHGAKFTVIMPQQLFKEDL